VNGDEIYSSRSFVSRIWLAERFFVFAGRKQLLRYSKHISSGSWRGRAGAGGQRRDAYEAREDTDCTSPSRTDGGARDVGRGARGGGAKS
jgi:hypothetical protein